MGHGQIYTVQPSNKQVRKLTDTGDNRFPVVSPNGKVIVFIRVHGSRFSLLTSAADCDNTAPAFSPNGRQIAFLSDRNSAQQGVYDLFTMGANVAQLTHFSAGVSAPAW